jgi:hypothetical protein
VLYIGIDDTDVIGSPGTNQLARAIVRRLGPLAHGSIVCRHQLFFDARVPYTSQNGSASIQLPRGGERPRHELVATVREVAWPPPTAPRARWLRSRRAPSATS